ncbi:arsenate reductase [Neisseria montereyensis]|uniref:Arsenate reductase n=1 Tax=Neisseria montereyensis TaxID=2973938 RepID=A0ABT2FC12_9NEIS|nr:arsenate reductase [Neisseria montereyensis]MCS4533751.1 arsenate reductase [Neisseria montereyensis]
MTTLYGITNCNTVKKARTWLDENHVGYEFVDFKKSPPDEALIKRWLKDIDLAVLLNKRGTTWRKLNSEQQAAAETEEGAIQLMVENPSLIKRPVLNHNGHFQAGFQTASYEETFGK